MSDEERRPEWPWPFLGVLGVLGLLGAYGLVVAEHMAPQGSLVRQARLVLAVAPALVTALWAFHPAVLARLRSWAPERVATLAVGLTVWVVLLSADRFDPYAVVIVGAAAGGAVLAMRGGVPPGRLGAAGLAVWMLLWIPFDLRWYEPDPRHYEGQGKHMALFLGDKGSYAICALLVVTLGVLAFGVVGRQEQGLRPPRWQDLPKALATLLGFAALAIPLGLAVGFLHPGVSLGWGEAGLVTLGIGLTVALPEELFFRGILDSGLRKVFKPAWASLLVSSLAFGLMHWNNRTDLQGQLIYFGLATVAGAFYGLAFRWSRGLFAPILFHTTVDVVWKAFLQK